MRVEGSSLFYSVSSCVLSFHASSLISCIILSLFSSNAVDLYLSSCFFMYSRISLMVSSAQFSLGLPTLLFLCVYFIDSFPLKEMLCRALLSLLMMFSARFLLCFLYASMKVTIFVCCCVCLFSLVWKLVHFCWLCWRMLCPSFICFFVFLVGGFLTVLLLLGWVVLIPIHKIVLL